MPTLIATKQFSYATRMLKPGETFEAKPNDARLLIAIKKAREVREPSKISPPPAGVAARIQQTSAAGTGGPLDHDGGGSTGGSLPASDRGAELDRLRAEATELGLTIDMRWGAKRLQSAIDEARKVR